MKKMCALFMMTMLLFLPIQAFCADTDDDITCTEFRDIFTKALLNEQGVLSVEWSDDTIDYDPDIHFGNPSEDRYILTVDDFTTRVYIDCYYDGIFIGVYLYFDDPIVVNENSRYRELFSALFNALSVTSSESEHQVLVDKIYNDVLSVSQYNWEERLRINGFALDILHDRGLGGSTVFTIW